VPILGPEDDVYAMHLWVGLRGDIAAKPRPAAGISWKAGDLQVQQRLESWLMSTDDPSGWKDLRSPVEFFRKVIRADEGIELFRMATDPKPGDRLHGEIVVLHDNGYTMNWDIIARSRVIDPLGVRGITHDVSDVRPPKIGPLETYGITVHPSATDSTAALVFFPPGRPRPSSRFGYGRRRTGSTGNAAVIPPCSTPTTGM
jgi:hypothetical protein